MHHLKIGETILPPVSWLSVGRKLYQYLVSARGYERIGTLLRDYIKYSSTI